MRRREARRTPPWRTPAARRPTHGESLGVRVIPRPGRPRRRRRHVAMEDIGGTSRWRTSAARRQPVLTRYCVSVRPNHSGFTAWLCRQGSPSATRSVTAGRRPRRTLAPSCCVLSGCHRASCRALWCDRQHISGRVLTHERVSLSGALLIVHANQQHAINNTPVRRRRLGRRASPGPSPGGGLRVTLRAR